MALNEAMLALASQLSSERLLFVSWSTAGEDASACELRHADFADPELLLQHVPTLVGCVQLLGPALLLLPARINSAQRRSLHSLADTAGLLLYQVPLLRPLTTPAPGVDALRGACDLKTCKLTLVETGCDLDAAKARLLA